MLILSPAQLKKSLPGALKTPCNKNNILAWVVVPPKLTTKGKEFIADGGNYAEARIILKRNGKPIIIANANRFSIGNNKISSQLAAVRVFFDMDSIYHSALKFKLFQNECLGFINLL